MHLLVIDDLTLRLRRGSVNVNVIEGVSLHVEAGHITCLVGESGCGKSLTARAVPGLLPGPISSF